MRKVLMLAILLAGTAVLAARATECGTAAQESSQPSAQSETVRKNGDRANTTRSERADESDGRSRAAHQEVHERRRIAGAAEPGRSCTSTVVSVRAWPPAISGAACPSNPRGCKC
jgi:hypothetical protein